MTHPRNPLSKPRLPFYIQTRHQASCTARRHELGAHGASIGVSRGTPAFSSCQFASASVGSGASSINARRTLGEKRTSDPRASRFPRRRSSPSPRPRSLMLSESPTDGVIGPTPSLALRSFTAPLRPIEPTHPRWEGPFPSQPPRARPWLSLDSMLSPSIVPFFPHPWSYHFHPPGSLFWAFVGSHHLGGTPMPSFPLISSGGTSLNAHVLSLITVSRQLVDN